MKDPFGNRLRFLDRCEQDRGLRQRQPGPCSYRAPHPDRQDLRGLPRPETASTDRVLRFAVAHAMRSEVLLSAHLVIQCRHAFGKPKPRIHDAT